MNRSGRDEHRHRRTQRTDRLGRLARDVGDAELTASLARRSCAETYRADSLQLVCAGLVGVPHVKPVQGSAASSRGSRHKAHGPAMVTVGEAVHPGRNAGGAGATESG